MNKTYIILLAVAVMLIFKLIKEIFYIKLYSFIIRLKAEGKLIPENDPKGVAEKAEEDLKKNASRWL